MPMTYDDLSLDSDDDPLRAIREGMDDHRRRRAELVKRISDKYFHTGRDRQVVDELTQLVDGTIASIDGNHPEGRMVVVVGDPGAGKTWAVERALASISGLKDGPLLSLVAPRPCTLKQLGRSILHALDYPLQRDLLEHLTWEKVRHQLALRRKQFVWIDEMHHAMGKNEDELAKLCDTLKNVMQQRNWPVSFILSGLPLVADPGGERAALNTAIAIDKAAYAADSRREEYDYLNDRRLGIPCDEPDIKDFGEIWYVTVARGVEIYAVLIGEDKELHPEGFGDKQEAIDFLNGFKPGAVNRL
jgi:hypothetical protein